MLFLSDKLIYDKSEIIDYDLTTGGAMNTPVNLMSCRLEALKALELLLRELSQLTPSVS